MAEVTLTSDALALPRHGRSRGSRAFRVMAVLLIVAGVLTLADTIVTLVWQEPLSALYATFKQDKLRTDLATLEHTAPPPVERHALSAIADEHHRIAYLARALDRSTKVGDPVGRIRIPAIGADYVVVKGTDTAALKSGPGVYSDTPFPGIGGTTAIAGHRTTYLAPFRHIDALKPGRTIKVEMPYAHFTYKVIGQRVVSPTDVKAAVANVGYTRLVLSACTPLFSAAKRLLVYARLELTVPVGAARLLTGGAVAHAIETHPKRKRPKPLKPVLKPFDAKGLAAV